MKNRTFLMRALAAALRSLKLVAGLPADLKRRRACRVMPGAVLHPSCRILNEQPRDHIVIGPRSQVLAMLQTMGHGGQIRVGADCYLGEGTRIWSAESVTIGDRVLISHGVNIHDNNAHSESAASRARHVRAIFGSGHPHVLDDVPASPVVIGNDAWIGFGATILKGVTVGEGAVVGACAMVTKDVAPYAKVVGNPARVVGRAEP